MQVLTAPDELNTVLEINTDNIFTFPDGIPAFETVRRYVILRNPEEAPFLWLQAVDDPELAFVVTVPSVFHPSYEVELSDDDVELLGLGSPEDALILTIITVWRGKPERLTANLTGPIVINWRTQVGKQVVPMNAADYSTRHDILAELQTHEERA